MDEKGGPMTTKPVQQQVSPPRSATKTHKLAGAEEAFMRKVMMFFVMGLCLISEAASLVIFFHANNAGGFEMAIALQLLPLLCVYKILSYLFPGPGVDVHPLIVLAKLLLKRP